MTRPGEDDAPGTAVHRMALGALAEDRQLVAGERHYYAGRADLIGDVNASMDAWFEGDEDDRDATTEARVGEVNPRFVGAVITGAATVALAVVFATAPVPAGPHPPRGPAAGVVRIPAPGDRPVCGAATPSPYPQKGPRTP